MMHVLRLFVYVATLRQPELVLCTSLPRCAPCSTADQLLGAHSTALSSISDADGRNHTVLQASQANMGRWGAQVLLLIMLVVRCCMPALLMVRLPNIPHCTGNKCTFECDTWTQYRFLVAFVHERTLTTFKVAACCLYPLLELHAPGCAGVPTQRTHLIVFVVVF